MKNYKTAGLLLGVLVVLGLIGTWDEWKTKQEEREKDEENKLVQFDPGSVTAINFWAQVTPEDETSLSGKVGTETHIRLELKDEHWHLVEPVAGLADDTAVKNLLTSIKDYKTEEVVSEDKASWNNYGLDKPTRKIELTQAGKTPEVITVFVGAKTPVGYSLYIATDQSNKAYVGNQYLLTATNKTLKDFRDKSIIKIDSAQLSSLTYQFGTTKPIVISKDADTYKIKQPAMEADSDAVNELIADLNSFRAEDFLDKPTAKFSHAFANTKDRVALSWTSASGSNQSIQFAEVDKTLWAAVDARKLAFKAPENFRVKITKTIDDFRNRRIFAFDAASVVSVDIDGESFTKAEANWVKAGDGDKPAHQPHVQSLLLDLEYAKADKFLTANDQDVKAAMKNAPQHRIKLILQPQTELVIDGWPDTKNASKFIVRRSGSPIYYRVVKSVFSNVKPLAQDAATPQPAAPSEEMPMNTDSDPDDAEMDLSN